MQNSEPRPAAYILQNTVSHARHVPSSSAHAFTYPTLALLLPLSALESHKLDIGDGRIFGYSGAHASSSGYASWARVTGIRPEAYLHDPDQIGRYGRRRSIREKLEDVLTRFGHDARELVDAWMLTMPSYLGVEGINPLTVFYCYKKTPNGTGDQLWLVVLEVHNTFGERHVYVLLPGPGHEDKITSPGFTHSWTFPRQFHVSPFNDRSGYYTCSIIAPPDAPLTSSLSSPTHLGLLQEPPLPLVRIQLYTPDRQLKLTAALRTKSAAPLTARNLLKALARYPLTLLLSFPRIAWQAFHLHYHRRLDVFARPEPRAVDPALEEVFSELAESQADVNEAKEERRKRTSNEVQKDEGELGVGGGVGWQPEGVLERYAHRRVEHFLETQAQSKRIRIHLISTNPSFGDRTFPQSSADSESKEDKAQANHPATQSDPRDLTLVTRSSRAFLLILASPSAVHALLIGRNAERLFTVSDERLFLELFSLTSGYKSNGAFVQHFLQWFRTRPIPQTLLQRSGSELSVPTVHPLDIPLPPLPPSSASSPPTILPEPGFLANLLHNVPTLLVLTAFYALTYIEKYIFTLLRARFVVGTEPWGGWVRAEEEWLTRAKARTRTQGHK